MAYIRKDENNVNAKRSVYFFGDGRSGGNARMKDLLGSKGANLAEITNIGIPVPLGFTISIEACMHYYVHDGGVSTPKSRVKASH
ncbi:MAG: hypothetical protein C4B59_02175 [Candidatus Methanogaster sp.]|uniref:Uncharacterized protein n=1 Tax=Candidatus Methanogaster sp. TaxID=3386292 RepID=A0AC61L5K2_9EURY|nr:MAG: hypothetical protein C4B59_02175 [ANME-2 cluster archaeon]